MSTAAPIVAMLWENWRLTRVEAAQRLGIGLVAGAIVLTFADAGAVYAVLILAMLHGLIWFSIAKLNGGRFADGYKPGFPFHLLYTRPVPTVLIVGVAMAYDAISCLALYLVSAAALGLAFGQPLPLLSLTLWIVASHFAYACVQWSTRNRIVQWVGSLAFGFPMFFLLNGHLATAPQVEFSLVENVAMIVMCVVAFVLTVAGVARQRRGDSIAFEPQPKAGMGGYPDWLVNLFGFQCPTSSATRAQVWFELKSSGLPVLMIGLAMAILIFLLYAISIPFALARHVAVSVSILSIPVMLIALGGNAFGIRRKQGRTYASAFELTQPYGTAQLVSLKVLVRTICVLVALTAVGLSVWASSAMLGAWGEWLADGKNDTLPKILLARQKVTDFVGGRAVHVYAAVAAVASIAVAGLVSWQAAREALRARYPRRVLVAQCVPIVFGFALVLLTLALRKGFGPVSLVGEIIKVAFWSVAAGMLLAAIYLLWSGFTERVLTLRYALGALVVSVAFVVAWRAGIPAGNFIGMGWMALVILTAIILAPWSFSRVRHV